MNTLEEPQKTGTKTRRSLEDDPAFLKAKGRFFGADDERKKAEREHVRKLANAIFQAMLNHGYAIVRAVGPFANHNAVKSITIATGYCSPKGIELCWQSSFDEGNIGELGSGHVEAVSATLYRVKDWKDWKESKGENDA